MKILTLEKLIEFLELMKATFGEKTLTTKHREALNTYILNINYESALAFDTKEIVTGENDGIILEENEAMALTKSGEILVNINDEYIIIEKGE